MDFSQNIGAKRPVIKRDSQIDVKQMCKKFETISTDEQKITTSNDDFPFRSVKRTDSSGTIEKKYLSLKVIDQGEDDPKVDGENSKFWQDRKVEPQKLRSPSSHPEKVPVAPIRRKKNKNLNMDKMKAIKTSTDVDISSDVNSNIPEKLVGRVSVRERSRLFNAQQLKSANDFGYEYTNKYVVNADPLPPSPPAKPPRTPNKDMTSLLNLQPNSTNKNYKSPISDDTLKKLVDLNKNVTKVSLSKKFISSNSTPSVTSSTKLISKTVPKVPNSPGINIDIMRVSFPDKNKPPKSPKLPTSSNKPNILKDCFSNLSSVATQIREKVTNKPSSSSGPLIPGTSVNSSPKYGTLQRSISEEHIYAEPFQHKFLEKNKGRASSDLDVLHYMCTPIIDCKFGNSEMHSTATDVITENQSTNGCSKRPRRAHGSVRSIIYESFSMLRKVPENEESCISEENINGDSESDVSIKDVQERITYVKSIKKQASTSSICIAPKLFDAILILNLSEDGPEVLFKQSKTTTMFDYPLIHHLCFPDYKYLRKVDIYKSEWFHFTLMNGENEKVFGYCYRILGWPEASRGFCRKLPVAVCILSGIAAPLFYKKILVEIEKHLILPTNKCVEYLTSLQKLGVPNAGASLSIPDDSENETDRVVVSRPFDSHTVGMELTRSLQLLDVSVLLKSVASLLLERRVLLLSNNSGNVLHCCTAISSLLYPFQWQHLLMPIVPSCLAVQCCIESPYLLGIVSANHRNILDLLGEQQVFVVDVDKGLVLKSFGDEDTILPKKVQKAVIGALNLAKNMTDPTEMMRDIMISEAVVHMFVEILGHCQDHFVFQNGVLVFQKEIFQKSSSSRSIQSFLEWFSETQMFEAFIEECIWRKTYRDVCQLQLQTFFEKRVEEYKWELAYDNEKITRKIVKRVQDLGEMLKGLKKN